MEHIIERLKNEFVENVKDYANDVNNFIDYLDSKRGKNSFYNELIIGGMTTEEVINSLKYLNDEVCRINKKTPAYKYISAIGELFYYILNNSPISNSDFLKQIDSKRNGSYYRQCTDFINNCSTLIGKEVYSALDDETVDRLLIWSDKMIADVLKESNQKVLVKDFKHMVAALFIKTVLLTGVTYREARTLKFTALNVKSNTLEINNYVFRLPCKMSEQFHAYKSYCKNKGFDVQYGYLFVDDDGIEWGESTSSSGVTNYLKTVIGQTDLTGIIKYGITQMILVGIDSRIIERITGVSDIIISDCTQHSNNDQKWFSYINSKIVSTEIYGKL